MSEEIIELKNKVAELEAQVRVMRGIIVQAMLQNNREQPAETGYARNPVAYSTSSIAGDRRARAAMIADGID